MFLATIAGAAVAVAISDVVRAAPETPPFGVPFEGPASLDTWMAGQWYGNTSTAFRQREEFYSAFQGLHFGVDLSCECRTPVVAIGDGVVRVVDGSHGAWPHHVVIDHPDYEVSSLYGHLLERSRLRAGERVSRGQVVGISGDSQTLDCNGAPHLHLELRYNQMRAATNPVLWIDADWPALTLGIREPGFAMDFANPLQWQSPFDQPDVQLGGPYLNAYDRAWPPT